MNNIKVCIVVAWFPNEDSHINVFIKEQIDAIKKYFTDIDFLFFDIGTYKNKLNYFIKRKEFKEFVYKKRVDIIHYHYGLASLVGLFQNFACKQIVTFHGSDININYHRYISQIAINKLNYSIFVSANLVDKVNVKNYSIIPCGVDTELFKPMDKIECRKTLNLNVTKKYILFPASKTNKVKNYNFLIDVLKFVKFNNLEIIELFGIQRKNVPILMNAVDVLVCTSLTEGSPQVIKEAAFCNTPIVALKVGDISKILNSARNAYICENNPYLFSDYLNLVLDSDKKAEFKNLLEYDNSIIAKKVHSLYHKLLGLENL